VSLLVTAACRSRRGHRPPACSDTTCLGLKPPLITRIISSSSRSPGSPGPVRRRAPGAEFRPRLAPAGLIVGAVSVESQASSSAAESLHLGVFGRETRIRVSFSSSVRRRTASSLPSDRSWFARARTRAARWRAAARRRPASWRRLLAGIEQQGRLALRGGCATPAQAVGHGRCVRHLARPAPYSLAAQPTLELQPPCCSMPARSLRHEAGRSRCCSPSCARRARPRQTTTDQKE